MITLFLILINQAIQEPILLNQLILPKFQNSMIAILNALKIVIFGATLIIRHFIMNFIAKIMKGKSNKTGKIKKHKKIMLVTILQNYSINV